MSWQSYVDDQLIGTGRICKAAIIGHDGFPQEGASIVAGFANADALREKGLHINSEKYFLIGADDRSIKGKQGQNGVFCVKTKQCVLIGVHDQDTQPGQASMVIEKLADYLIEVGY
ncbi:profilin, required for normal timing of actin polymerization in response to thermal stress [Entomophthora muscae]|nr:profilin, required for normal timing of actin polymerization in response to thermal stress [Entomophthora muscae]